MAALAARAAPMLLRSPFARRMVTARAPSLMRSLRPPMRPMSQQSSMMGVPQVDSRFMTNVKETVTNYLPELVEFAEPQIEFALRNAVRKLRAQYSDRLPLFQQNWNRINAAVQDELQRPAVFGAKRTRKHQQKKKQRKNVV